jgi:hypothetical protein
VEGSGCCRLRPACGPCQRRQAIELANETRAGRGAVVDGLVEVEEPVGFGVDDAVWDVAWLEELRELPREAVWPRLMSVPHPRAVGSLGREFEWWVWARTGRRLRWFQRLFVRRLLEVDAAGALVWETALLTMARQLGKSWLLRELLMWRLHQGERFGQPQELVHIAMTVQHALEVLEPEQRWAEVHSGYQVREAHLEQSLTWLVDRSRWLLASKGTKRSGGAYGKSTALGVVDEAWAVRAATVDEALEPTTVATAQSQLLLVSTAHRMATSLMLDRRAAALELLHDPAEGDLIVEWSAPRDCDLEDWEAWRLASPHWTPQRERLIAKAVRRALSGFGSDDPDEPDPVEAVRAQWLNIWPAKLSGGVGQALVDVAVWASLRRPEDAAPGELWVAVEDNYGRGAAVAAVAALGGDAFEVDGQLWTDRAEALREAHGLVASWSGPATLVVSPALDDDDAVRAGPADTRYGLSLLRSLVAQRRLVHDDTPELDGQLAAVRVREMPGGGLSIVGGHRADLVRALAWALRAALHGRFARVD